MIFAELQYESTYSEAHWPLVALLGKHFPKLEHGLQGDSWVWVNGSGVRVAIDTFTSMHHQVKSSAWVPLVGEVISVLAREYRVRLIDPPELEAHEVQEEHE